MKGSVGTATSTIIYTGRYRKRRTTKAVRSNCHNCIHSVVNGENVANCRITGEIAVRKYYCEHYKRKKVSGKQ